MTACHYRDGKTSTIVDTRVPAFASVVSNLLFKAWSVGQSVSQCFKPSQPRRIRSGLRETFTKRYVVERTSKAEIRPEEKSEKVDSCQNLWNEIQLKGP